MFSSKLVGDNFGRVVEELVRVTSTRYELVIGVCVFFLVYVIRDVIKRARSNFPPGPTGLPLVGYLPFMSEDVHLDLIELGKKYGDVFSVRLGTEMIVVLNSGDAIREAFAKPEFLGRPPHSALTFLPYKSASFTTDVNVWREQRRFIVHSMKDLGLGKSKIEQDIQDEIHQLLELLRSFDGKPMDLKVPLSPSISNNICALVFGKRLALDDPLRQTLDHDLDQVTDVIGQASAPTLFPWIRHLPFITKLLPIEKGIAAVKRVLEFQRREVEQHKKTLDPRNVRDFLDSYLVQMESKKKKDPHTSFSEEMLYGNVFDIFAAGSETVRISILWCIYIMAAYPDIQKKVKREILEVIGPDRILEYPDHLKMPYTDAVILEALRWKTIVPLNLLHYTVADTTAGGYNIPKGMLVIANLWAAHNDPKVWDEPESFKPERFLSADGKSVVKSNNLMTFSFGKRVCPGEPLANMEVFLYFTSILQKFDVAFAEGVTPTFKGHLGILFKPKPFLVRFFARN